jgi:hypothetical protein
VVNCITKLGTKLGWGGDKSVIGPNISHRVAEVAPWADYSTEVTVGSTLTKITASVDTAWRSCCTPCDDKQVEKVERGLVAEVFNERLANFDERPGLPAGELRLTIPASEMVQQYEGLKSKIETYLLSNKFWEHRYGEGKI